MKDRQWCLKRYCGYWSIAPKALFALLLSYVPAPALADIAVIVHPSSQINTLVLRDLGRIFLGKQVQHAGGRVVPLDHPEDSKTRNAFYRQVTRKSGAQLNAYWSRLIFTGRGQPPSQVVDQRELLDLVGDNPQYIGYIDVDLVDDSVKVIHLLEH